MPSGTTSKIYEGDASVRNYLLRVGRAMGFSILQRDADPDEPPKPFPPSTYHAEMLEEARAKQVRLAAMTPSEITRGASAWNHEQLTIWRETMAAKEALRARYEAVRQGVEDWTPPQGLEGAKEYALRQLDDSIQFDCRTGMSEPTPLSAAEWYRRQVEHADHDIEYHTEKHAEEVKRARERNAAILAFLVSLPEDPVDPANAAAFIADDGDWSNH